MEIDDYLVKCKIAKVYLQGYRHMVKNVNCLSDYLSMALARLRRCSLFLSLIHI